MHTQAIIKEASGAWDMGLALGVGGPGEARLHESLTARVPERR